MATEYAAQVAAAPSPSRIPPTLPGEPAPAPPATSATPGERDADGDPVAGVQALRTGRPGDQRDEDGQRSEDERGRRRIGEVNRVDEAHLVQVDPDTCGAHHERDVALRDAEAPLPGVGVAAEDGRSAAEAGRRIDERQESVQKPVLDGREVEAPEQRRQEQQDVRGQTVAHGVRW